MCLHWSTAYLFVPQLMTQVRNIILSGHLVNNLFTTCLFLLCQNKLNLFFLLYHCDILVSFRVKVRGINLTEPVQPQSATFTVKIPSYGVKIMYIREVWLATKEYFDHPLWAEYSAPPFKVSNYNEVINITSKYVNNAWKELNFLSNFCEFP